MCRILPWFVAVIIVEVCIVSCLCSEVHAQRQQYKIEPNGTVLKLKRLNVTTFEYRPFTKAELRRDAQGRSIWYFQADTGKEYTALAPNQTPAPNRYNAAQLTAAFATAQRRGQIPTAVRVETFRGMPVFYARFDKNTLQLRWHAQAGMSPQDYETVNRTLRQQGYRSLFAEPYVNGQGATRFVAGWRL